MIIVSIIYASFPKMDSKDVKRAPTMNVFDFGDVIVLGKRVGNFKNLAENGFNVGPIFERMGWVNYFELRKKPIYNDLVR